MLRNEIEHCAEYKRSSDGNQRGGDNDIAQAAVIVVADPEGVPKHSAGKGEALVVMEEIIWKMMNSPTYQRKAPATLCLVKSCPNAMAVYIFRIEKALDNTVCIRSRRR